MMNISRYIYFFVDAAIFVFHFVDILESAAGGYRLEVDERSVKQEKKIFERHTATT